MISISRTRFLYFVTMLLSSVFCGYYVSYEGIYAQSILMLLIVLSNFDILYTKFNELISKHYLICWLLICTVVLSSITSFDFLLHVKETFRFILVISTGLILSFYATIFSKQLAMVLASTIVLISCLSFLVYLGVNIYPVVGERFGFPRPFLFANPITLSILLGASLCYVSSKYSSYFVKFFSFFGLLSFWSYTGLVVYFIVRHKMVLGFLVVFVTVFLSFSVEVGSFFIRAKIIENAVESLVYLNVENLLFGVGFRNLDLWNDSHDYLHATTDITFFVRVIYEFGVFGFFTLIVLMGRLLTKDVTLFLVLLFLLLSIDQVAHFWVLPFAFLLSSTHTTPNDFDDFGINKSSK